MFFNFFLHLVTWAGQYFIPLQSSYQLLAATLPSDNEASQKQGAKEKGKAEALTGPTRDRQDYFGLNVPKELSPPLLPPPPPCVPRLPKFGLMLSSLVGPAEPPLPGHTEAPVQMTGELGPL